MNKKEVLELKRRFKKEAATFTRVCGCYVDGNHNKVCKFGNTFLNLEEDEFYKYLEIANKALSGTIGNNLLELKFPIEEEEVGGRPSRQNRMEVICGCSRRNVSSGASASIPSASLFDS